jgi:hypothetical protein
VSRSRRKTPRFGITTAESEKEYKQQEHSRERSAVRDALITEDDMPSRKKFGNRWGGPKDGKRYWKKAKAKDMRK